MSTSDHLCTPKTGESNALEVLKDFAEETAVLVHIHVSPKNTRTGFLEERNEVIHGLWNTMIARGREFHGCRLMWDSVFFVFSIADLNEAEAMATRVIASLVNEKLEIRCIIFHATGSVEDKCNVLINRMAHDAASHEDFIGSSFSDKYIDEDKCNVLINRMAHDAASHEDFIGSSFSDKYIDGFLV